ncbi:MAG: hypothetical protein JWL63_327 [Rhodocyclales bacterium]|nr:hypothetical protein [Rhodocyclales bacterium]
MINRAMPLSLHFHALAICGALIAPSAYAGDWRGTTGLQLSETYTDNIGRQSAGQKRGDFATEVSPYLSYAGRGARTSGSLDARLQNWLHSDSQTSNRTGLQLSAIGSVEAYEDHLFIDSSLSNDRQQISQFRAADANYGGTSNSTEVTRFSLSPYLRWRLGSATDAGLRYRYEKVQSEASFATGQTESLSLDLRNGSAFGRLGWAFNATHNDTERQSAEAASTNSYNGTLTYAVTPTLVTSLTGGQEFTDFEGGDRQHYWNWGGGLQWQPDERTTISAQTSKRFFGRGFNYQFSHRFQRSAIEWSYSRDLNVVSSAGDLNSPATQSRAKQALIAEMAALASSIPDPSARLIVALEHLQAQGISAYDLMQLDYLSGQSSIDKNMRLAWVMYGVRNSLTLSIFRSERQAISQTRIVQLSDDLSTHDHVKNRGWDVSWTHNLSALTTAGLHYGYGDISGETTTGQLTSSHTSTVGLNLNTKLAPFTTGGVAYNHTRSKGSAEYRENAVTVQLNHQF